MTLPPVDLALAVVVGGLAFRGIWRGLTGEVLSLLGMAGGFLGAWRLGPAGGALLEEFAGVSPGTAVVGAMVLIFALAMVLAAMGERLVKAFLKFTHLSLLDRGLGGLCGLVKAALVVLLVYAGGLFASGGTEAPWMRESRFLTLAGTAWPLLEASLRERGIAIPRGFEPLPGALGVPGEVRDLLRSSEDRSGTTSP